MISLLLCALLTACPLTTLSAPAHQIPLSQTSLGGETPRELFEELEGLAKIVEACSDDTVAGLEVLERWNVPDVKGFVARGDTGDVYVVFDGEYGYADALVDLAIPLSFEVAGEYGGGGGGLVHGGFRSGWESVGASVVERVRGSYEKGALNVVGRGVGGAVAALAALDFAVKGWGPKLTTFGQPRFGDTEFMKFFQEKIPSENFRRVTHVTDPVPLLEFSEIGLVHANGEYLIHKPSPPYRPSDLHKCPLSSEDPICGAHERTSPFSLPFTPSAYLTAAPTDPGSEIDVLLDVTFSITQLGIDLLPLDLDFDFSLEPTPNPSPSTSPSPFLQLTPPPTTHAKRGVDKALEYFYLPKDQLEASLAEAAAIAEYEASLAEQDPAREPEGGKVPLEDEEDLISMASSVITYNGRPVEMNGRPTRLASRGILDDKEKLSRNGKGKGKGRGRKCGGGSGSGAGLAIESTTPACTVSEARVEEEVVGVGENSFEDEAVNVQKGRNFRVYNGVPVRKGVSGVERVEEGSDGKGALRKRAGEGRGVKSEFGWGKYEPHMRYLEGLSEPTVMSTEYEHDLDSEAWVDETPSKEVKDRFWRSLGLDKMIGL